MSKVYDWFEERLEIQSVADDITSKYVPPHVNIFYCFGGIVLTCFLVQVATGFAMTFYYRPTVSDAFASVEYIMKLWMVNSFNSPMVCKHDGFNVNSSCFPSVLNRWI
jgi:quinol-cytochrome oxidoreductase complex cytochrome b subunit